MASSPAYRLVRPAPPPPAALALDEAQRAVVDHVGGPLRVLAGPGTGKTTTIVESVARRIERGADPEQILVLTFSRRAAAELRVRIAARVGRTIREPLARTFHSYAFGLLRRSAAGRGEPAPRLLSGPEQDALIRELLHGDSLRAGAVAWPDRFALALRTRGFAAELRDLMLRAFERGVTPRQLAAWGRERGRDDWPAAAVFMQQYADVTALAAGPSVALDPAELIRAAVDLFLADPDLLSAERDRAHAVYVDEYQDTDPAQEELLRLLAGQGRDLVVVGDPDQSIYAFRGAAASGIQDFPDRFPRPDGSPAPTLALSTCRRSGAMLLAASRQVIDRVSGSKRTSHRELRSSVVDPGAVGVHVLTSASQEAAYIAHRLREAHLREGIPWSQMAVLVRSTTRALAVLRRAFLSAGVPVAVAGDELPLAEQPAAKALLDVLDAAIPARGGGHREGIEPLEAAIETGPWPEGFGAEQALVLLTSPLVGADALTLRRLRRALLAAHVASRAALGSGHAVGSGDAAGTGEAAGSAPRRPSGQLLVEALREPGDLLLLDDQVAAPARRLAGLLAAARTAAAAPGATAEDILWAVWQTSGLGPRWQRLSREAGPPGAGAHRDLDAVVALFDAAARFVDRLPGEGPRSFLAHVRSQQIPGDSLAARAPSGESVRVLTAHAAKGLEWDLVVVAGVQEGRWPDLRVRGSLLGSEQLVDLAAGRDPSTLSAVSGLRDEEWRLFYVAVTRARRQLIVTAVDSEDGTVPSRLLDALDEPGARSGPRPHTDVPRTTSLPALVAELRAVLTDPASPTPRRDHAARALAGLRVAAVPGADPGDWWGALPLSDERPLREPGEQVSVSPSKTERFATCGLRWLLESAGGSSGPGASQSVGTVVHDAATLAVDATVDLDTLLARLEQSWSQLDLGGPWYEQKQRDSARRMLDKLLGWVRQNPRELIGTELEFDVPVGRAVLRGRVDRLERDGSGRLVVVDLKTGASSPSKAQLVQQAQLGAYQVAVEHGGFAVHGRVSAGAELLQLKNGQTARGQAQPPLSAAEDPGWAEQMVQQVADGMAGATFVATENDQCRQCPVATSCPLQAQGRQVTA